MSWGVLAASALNSNVGQTLLSAGAEKAADEIFGNDGFGGEEVGSPIATVEAPAAAPLNEAPKAVEKKKPKWMLWAGVSGVLLVGSFLLKGVMKGKGGK